MLQQEKTAKSNFDLKFAEVNSQHAKDVAALQRTLDGKQNMI